MRRTAFQSIEELKQESLDNDYSFFTTRRFDEVQRKVESDLIRGRFFITSDQTEFDEYRQFAARHADLYDGEIFSLGFYKTYQEAIDAIEEYANPKPDKPEQTDGWIAPDGKFYACGYAKHDEFANRVAGIDAWRLEERGWVHISSGNINNSNDFRLTQAQRNTLFDIQMINPRSYRAEQIADLIGV